MMWKPNRVHTSLAGMIAVMAIAAAQPPADRVTDGSAQLTLPAVENLDNAPSATTRPKPDPETESRIRSALRGDAVEARDPLLDGVLDAIHDQGSVLDGSSLDRREFDRPRFPQPSREARGGPARSTADGLSGQSPASRQARLAEQMLRTARLMERELSKKSERGPSTDRDELRFLIHRLRHQAGRFLIESRPAQPNEDRRQ